jgi:hypothetical protein
MCPAIETAPPGRFYKEFLFMNKGEPRSPSVFNIQICSHKRVNKTINKRLKTQR